MDTAAVCHRLTNVYPTSTQTRMGNATNAITTATSVQDLEKPTVWAATRDIFYSVSVVWCFVSESCTVLWKTSLYLWLVSKVTRLLVLLLQMAHVWMSARQASTRMCWHRNASLATRPATAVWEGTATSVSLVKPTYFERAKSAWRSASTGSLTRWLSSTAARPSPERSSWAPSLIKDQQSFIVSLWSQNHCFSSPIWTDGSLKTQANLAGDLNSPSCGL